MITPAQEERAKRVDIAVTEAVELLEKYSNLDPHSAVEWRDPDAVFVKLTEARSNLEAAWNFETSDVDEKEDEITQLDEARFRSLYMDMITSAFADVLESIRAEEDDVDVGVLVDCLQSGMDFMSSEEKEFFLQDQDGLFDEGMDDSSLTPHEERRREIGFNIEVQS